MNFLIVGGVNEERIKKAKEIIKLVYNIDDLDTVLVSGESSIGIEKIKELKSQLSFKPYVSSKRGVIIHPAEILTIEAQNALLKTLEETGEDTIIVLTSLQSESLLPTVVSRCQIIRLLIKPGINFDINQFNYFLNVLTLLAKNRVGEKLKFTADFSKNKEEISQFFVNLLFFNKEIFLLKFGINNFPFDVSKIATIIDNLPVDFFLKLIKNNYQAIDQLDKNVNPKVVLENFFVSF